MKFASDNMTLAALWVELGKYGVREMHIAIALGDHIVRPYRVTLETRDHRVVGEGSTGTIAIDDALSRVAHLSAQKGMLDEEKNQT